MESWYILFDQNTVFWFIILILSLGEFARTRNDLVTHYWTWCLLIWLTNVILLLIQNLCGHLIIALVLVWHIIYYRLIVGVCWLSAFVCLPIVIFTSFSKDFEFKADRAISVITCLISWDHLRFPCRVWRFLEVLLRCRIFGLLRLLLGALFFNGRSLD